MSQVKPPRPNPPLTQAKLGQLCAALWDSRSRPVVTQPGIEPGSEVTPQVLRCSSFDRCATQEALSWNFYLCQLADSFIQSDRVVSAYIFLYWSCVGIKPTTLALQEPCSTN